MRCFRSLALAGAFGTFVVAAAQAADMAFPPMEGLPEVSQQQPTELGTGWYLRGDAAWSRDRIPMIAPSGDPAATNYPTIAVLPAALTNAFSLDLGIGYKLNNWLRMDLVYDYRKPQSAGASSQIWCPYNLNGVFQPGSNPVLEYGYFADPKNQCDQRQRASVFNQDVLLNGYFDLGTWGGITPYVGAGVGLVRTQQSGSVSYFETANNTPYAANLLPDSSSTYPQIWVNAAGTPITAQPNCPTCPQPNVSFTQQNWNRTIKNTSYGLAWALMGGLAIDVTDHLKLDVGYRYVDLGSITATDANTGQKVKEKQSTQEIRAGFRYMIN